MKKSCCVITTFKGTVHDSGKVVDIWTLQPINLSLLCSRSNVLMGWNCLYGSVWATRFPIHRACGHFSFDTNVEHKLNFAVPVSSSLSTWKPSMLFACKSCVIQFLYIAWPWTTSLWFDKKAEIVFSLCCRCPPLSGWLKAGRMCRSVFQMES